MILMINPMVLVATLFQGENIEESASFTNGPWLANRCSWQQIGDYFHSYPSASFALTGRLFIWIVGGCIGGRGKVSGITSNSSLVPDGHSAGVTHHCQSQCQSHTE